MHVIADKLVWPQAGICFSAFVLAVSTHAIADQLSDHRNSVCSLSLVEQLMHSLLVQQAMWQCV